MKKKKKKEMSGPFTCSFPHLQAQLMKRGPDGYSVLSQFIKYMLFTGREAEAEGQGLSFLGDVAALVRSHMNDLQPFESTIEQNKQDRSLGYVLPIKLEDLGPLLRLKKKNVILTHE